MYLDGHFIGAITLSQAVAEGLSEFLCEKNGLKCPRKNHLERVNKLLRENIISHEAKDAFEQIHDGRKDFHHMNKDIETEYSKLEAKAKLSVDSLYLIEEEMFRFSWADGGEIVQVNPKYWDKSSDGTSQVFLRCLL